MWHLCVRFLLLVISCLRVHRVQDIAACERLTLFFGFYFPCLRWEGGENPGWIRNPLGDVEEIRSEIVSREEPGWKKTHFFSIPLPDSGSPPAAHTNSVQSHSKYGFHWPPTLSPNPNTHTHTHNEGADLGQVNPVHYFTCPGTWTLWVQDSQMEKKWCMLFFPPCVTSPFPFHLFR